MTERKKPPRRDRLRLGPESEAAGIALVGYGAWGENHARVWEALGALRTVVECDPGRSRAVRTAYPHCTVTASLDGALADPRVSGVVVATPAATHAEIGLAALEAGKDVLVEKPLALSLIEGEKLAEAAESSGRVLMVDHLLAYHPAIERLEQLLAEGVLGRVRYVYSNRLNFGRVRTEESALWSFAPHDLALLHQILGSDPIEVACHGGAYLNAGVADLTLTALSFPGEVRAHVFVSWLHPFKEHRFIVVGEREMVVFDDTAPWPEKLLRYPHRVDWIDGRLPVARRADAMAEPLTPEEPLAVAARHFLRCVTTRTPPRTGADNGLAVLRMLDAAERSLSSGGSSTQVDKPAIPAAYVHPTGTVDPGASVASGSKVWHYSHVMDGASIGHGSILGQNVFVGRGVRIGDGVKVQNNVSVYEGVLLEDDVFCGPSAVFTNVINPRATIERKADLRPTLVRQGATIGANATIICGATVGRHAFVGAGAVVTHDVPDFALVVGVPARVVGWVCACGSRLDFGAPNTARCEVCDRHYTLRGEHLEESAEPCGS